MTVPLADCPTDEMLARYLDDGLSPTVTGPLTTHIDACPACQAKLDQITTGSGVSDRLRVLSSGLLRATGDSTLEPGVVAVTATDTQVFGADGIPMVPRVQVVRPKVPGYEVDGEIGRGGMGVVFKAQHKRLNRTVALKMVLAAGVADPRVTQRFLFEAEVLARVQHPQVVQVYEVNMFTAPTGVVFPYLAMELLSGGTLVQWAGGRALPPAEAAELIEGLARAVHAVHAQGIVHRDLKPANILRSADGVFKVSDFGLAKLTAEAGAGLTGTGMVVGTPAYMAPEQAGGDGPVGPPADVYSLGAMLFELLSGRPPFPGDDAMSVLLKVIRDPAPDVRSVQADVPRDLAAVVMKCLEKEPAHRYQSADDLADDLRRFLNRRPTRARTLSAVERVWYWARRNPAVASLLTGLAVAITFGFVSTFVLWQLAEGTARERERARARAQDKSAEAEEARRKADRTSAYALFDQGVTQCEAGYVGDGLAVFVKALGLAERLDERPLARVLRANIAAWEQELHPAGRRVHGPAAFGATDFSPDGKRVIAADADGMVRVYDADTLAEEAAFDSVPLYVRVAEAAASRATGEPLPLNSRVTGVAIDPTGRWAAACTLSGRVVTWSLARRRAGASFEVISPRGRVPGAWRAAFTADGRLWVGGDDGVLHGYDPASGKLVAVCNLPGIPHPNGQAAVLGGTSFLLALAQPDRSPDDPAVEDAVTALTQYRTTSVMSVRASPDGTRLFAGDRRGQVTEWDPATGQLIATYSFAPEHPWVYGIAVSADGRYVAAAATDGTARLWPRQPGTPSELWRIDLGGAQGSGVALSADGRQWAVGDKDGRVTVHDTRTRRQIGPALSRVSHVHLTLRPGTGELLLNEGGDLRLLPVPAPRCVPVPFDPPAVESGARVRFLDFRPDGGALLVGCGGLGVFDPATGRPTTDRRSPVVQEPLAGRFSDDGTRILYSGRHEWGMLDAADFTRRHFSAHRSAYIFNLPARPSASGVYVRVSSAVFVYRADTFEKVRVVGPKNLPEHGEVGRLIATPDGREWRLVNGDTVEFLEPVTGTRTRAPLRPGGPITNSDQTPDGRFLLLQVGENAVQVWDADKTERVNTVHIRHRGAVTALAVSPDAGVMLTGGRDRTTQYWDAETGLVLGPRRTHSSSVTTAAYSPTGKEVAVGTADGLTVVWPVPPPPTAEPLDELEEKFPSDGTPAGGN